MDANQNHDPQKAKPERSSDSLQAEKDLKDRVNTLENLGEADSDQALKHQEDLNAKGEGGSSPPETISKLWRLALIIFFVLIIAVGAYYFTTANDLLTGFMGASPRAVTHEELVLQEPIDITNGPWRFFQDESEETALFDIKFEADGTCYVPGDQIVYGGKYFVEGNNIEIELYRRYTAEAKDGEGNTRSQVVEWIEWFHMIRAGNTMTGSREVEVWRFDYDQGLTWRDNVISGQAIFSRPERPEDPG